MCTEISLSKIMEINDNKRYTLGTTHSLQPVVNPDELEGVVLVEDGVIAEQIQLKAKRGHQRSRNTNAHSMAAFNTAYTH